MQARNRTILITGGGSGIGRGLAESFHQLGNEVIIAGRDAGKLEATVAANPGMAAMTLDVDDPGSIAAFAADVVARHPSLDVLINNAGIMRAEDVKSGDLAAVDPTVTTNLLGPIRLTAALMQHLLSRPRATVVNVSSGLAFVPMPQTPTYNATKAAIHSYTVSLREQLRDTAVDVVEIIPPYVQTMLTGEGQANDPQAMPLGEYIAATMEILAGEPDVEEVVIERVAGLRFAEKNGAVGELVGLLKRMGEG